MVSQSFQGRSCLIKHPQGRILSAEEDPDDSFLVELSIHDPRDQGGEMPKRKFSTPEDEIGCEDTFQLLLAAEQTWWYKTKTILLCLQLLGSGI